MSALQQQDRGGTPTEFRLDRANGKVMGVCAGLANRFGGDPLAWRLMFVLGTVLGFGCRVFVYLAIGLLAYYAPAAGRPAEIRNGEKSVSVSNTSTPSRRFKNPTTA
jgi:phage shock protein PspC (stress-responsive transcriptional regulator)